MSSNRSPGLFSRRAFLTTGVLGGVASAYVAASVQLQSTKRLLGAPPQDSALNRDDFAILTAVCDRVCPADGLGAPGAVAIGVPDEIVRRIAEQSPAVQQELRLALRIVESGLVGLLSGQGYRPFTRQSAAQQDQTLMSFRTSSRPEKRTIYLALRNTVTALYYGSSRTWARLNYDGPPDPKALRAASGDLLIDFESLRGGGA